MPDLYYGPYGLRKHPELYTPGMQPVMTAVFDRYRLEGLAPRHRKRHVAHLWHWRDRKHTILSWHDTEVTPYEHTILIPALLNRYEALEYARLQFEPVMPSPITFRLHQDYDEVLLYDD